MTQPPPAESDIVEPPSRPTARSGREVLERVMLQLSRLPAKVDRGPVVAALGSALAALSRLDRSEIDDPDHLDLLRAAVLAAGQAHGEMSKAEASGDGALAKSLAGVFDALSRLVEPTIDLVVTRQEKLFRRRAEAPPQKLEQHVFRASAGVPRLFSFERPPLPLLLLSAPPASAVREEEAQEIERRSDLDADDDAAALDAAPPEPASLEAPDEAASLERELWDGWEDGAAFSAEEAELMALRRIARDAAEELGSLGLLRTPVAALPHNPWAVGPEAFEERLLRNLDAFMAVGEPFVSHSGADRCIDVLAALLDWAGDAMVPDPARAFARAFVLGCVAGDDTAAAAVLALRQSHPITYEAQRDALSLAPNPGLGPLLERMIAEESPPLVRVGLAVLERRREAAFEVVAPLLSHPNAGVRAAAARCLAAATAPQAALSLLVQHAGSEEDDAALAATAESLLLLGSRRGLEIAREKLGEEAAFPGSLTRTVRADHLRLLALAGGPADADLLLASLGHDATAALALGWFGDAMLVPAMLGALASSAGIAARAGFCNALTRALHRITGLGRTPESDPNLPLWLVEPSLDPGFWARAWEEKREGFAQRRKYRFGRPFSPLLGIDEAMAGELPALARRELLLELAITSRGASRVHGEDWVARQRTALGELREHFRRGMGAYPDGQWPRGALFE